MVIATDGQNAIYTARHEQPDLILLDIMMPKMDGYQFLRQFRQERQTPVIIVTAREEETDAVLGLDLGADDYVVKPFRMRELLARIRAVLRRKDADQEKFELLRCGPIVVDERSHSVTVDGAVGIPHPHRVRPAGNPHAFAWARLHPLRAGRPTGRQRVRRAGEHAERPHPQPAHESRTGFHPPALY